jgi:sporulation protein YlmC with PRC-barrel domain
VNVSDILGRNVLDLTTATTIGRVDDVVIDPTTRRVTAFHLAKASTSRAWLPYGNVSAVGADALTITDEGQLLDVPGDAGAGLVGLKALGGRVLTDQGREIGPLEDIDINDDGTVNSLSTAVGWVTADDLIGIGSYAVIVSDHTEQR